MKKIQIFFDDKKYPGRLQHGGKYPDIKKDFLCYAAASTGKASPLLSTNYPRGKASLRKVGHSPWGRCPTPVLTKSFRRRSGQLF